MRLNILEAKNRLSELVRAACAGKEVVIAKNGRPMVRLVPIKAAAGLKGFGSLKSGRGDVDKAFTPAAEREVARLFAGGRRRRG
jgi:prevent-host-death family protein